MLTNKVMVGFLDDLERGLVKLSYVHKYLSFGPYISLRIGFSHTYHLGTINAPKPVWYQMFNHCKIRDTLKVVMPKLQSHTCRSTVVGDNKGMLLQRY